MLLCCGLLNLQGKYTIPASLTMVGSNNGRIWKLSFQFRGLLTVCFFFWLSVRATLVVLFLSSDLLVALWFALPPTVRELQLMLPQPLGTVST